MNAPLTWIKQGEQPQQIEADLESRPYYSSPKELLKAAYPAIHFTPSRRNAQADPSWKKFVPDIHHLVNHGLNVAVVAVQIGARMGLSGKQLSYLFVGGVLHDVGKGYQDPQTLFKPDKLTDEEFDLIRTHAQDGAELVRQMDVNDLNDYIRLANNTGRINLPLFEAHETDVARRVARIVEQHHEHFDGTGYPYRLKGSQITLLSRIMTAADVFSACTEGRKYNPLLTPHMVLSDMMAGQRQKRYDPNVLQALARYVRTAYGPPQKTTETKADPLQAFPYHPTTEINQHTRALFAQMATAVPA